MCDFKSGFINVKPISIYFNKNVGKYVKICIIRIASPLKNCIK